MAQVSTQQEVTDPIVDESIWRQELEQLDRLLVGRLTEAEAKEYARTEQTKHDGVVRTIEVQIAQTKEVLTSSAPFLPRGDRQRLQDRIESLEYDLAAARKLSERSILKCGAGIKAGKEADKQRPRWAELRRRQQAIESAMNVARGREPELRVSVPHKFVG
jgi:hypothetical protein